MPMRMGRSRATPAKGGGGGVEGRSSGGGEGVRGEGRGLCVAGFAFDQLGGGEGNSAACQRQRQALGDRRLGDRAIEQPDWPEIEPRLCHARALARSFCEGLAENEKCPARTPRILLFWTNN